MLSRQKLFPYISQPYPIQRFKDSKACATLRPRVEVRYCTWMQVPPHSDPCGVEAHDPPEHVAWTPVHVDAVLHVSTRDLAAMSAHSSAGGTTKLSRHRSCCACCKAERSAETSNRPDQARPETASNLVARQDGPYGIGRHVRVLRHSRELV
jgi:hypothetical protein